MNTRTRRPGTGAKIAPPESVRLQKLLSQAGVASRRAAEKLIEEGRVKVDGRVVTELGTRVLAGSARVTVDDKPVEVQDRCLYLLMHKPRATICTAIDPEKRERVFDLITERVPRLWTVGRLDFMTTGALLITNDGELTAALTHPSRRIERVYDVKLRRELSGEELAKLAEGLALEDGELTESIEPELLDGDRRAWWYRIVLHEGRNREVRRIFETLDVQLQKLHRASFAGIPIDGVRPADYRALAPGEVARLREMVGLRFDRATMMPFVHQPKETPRRGAKVRASAARGTRGDSPPRSGSATGSRKAPPSGRGAR